MVKEAETTSHCFRYGKLLCLPISQALTLGKLQSFIFLPSWKTQVRVVKEVYLGGEIVVEKSIDQVWRKKSWTRIKESRKAIENYKNLKLKQTNTFDFLIFMQIFLWRHLLKHQQLMIYVILKY